MLDGILMSTYLREVSTLPIAGGLILLLSLIFSLLRFRFNILILFATLVTSLILCRLMFALTGQIYDFILILEGVLITFIVSTLYRHFVAEKEKRFIEHAFGHYISPDVVRDISANPESLKL